MMKRFWLSVLLLLPLGLAGAATFEAGKDYRVLPQAQPTMNPDHIEVVELFWYGCPHCHRFEPYIDKWLKTKPDNVDFIRMPAVLREKWSLHARAYYTAETLGILDKIHKPLFDAIHVEKRYLFDEDSLMQFFAEFGVSNEEFRNTFHSFAVDSKVRRARQMSKRYMATGTPAVVVNGKYLTGPGMAKGFDNLIKVIDFLVAREMKAHKAN
jgi:thiol:disulfide interchange protein DsbA